MHPGRNANPQKKTRKGKPRRGKKELSKILLVTRMDPKMKRLIIVVASNGRLLLITLSLI
ncbi:hypothetical protein KCA24_34945, partial [Escherichia coli]|nr:hypothetical protein [Escherichia coli]